VVNPGDFTHGGGHWIADLWRQKLSEVIASMTQAPAEAAGEPGADPPEGAYYYEIPVGADPASSLIIGAPEDAWMAIGGAALGAVGLDGADAADTRNTYIEILVQATANLAAELARKLGRDVAAHAGRDLPAGEAANLDFHTIALTLGAGNAVHLFLAPAAALVEAVELADQPTAHGSQPKTESEGPPAEAAGANALSGRAPEVPTDPGPLGSSKTLDLLLEVELPVSVSFGKTELMLRDVLKLTSGSIVEMSRTTHEPVDVIVNNCVIARGEVVVVDGNYGVRISKISSLRDRLRVVR
jgi:flagellar motor switch protein FliN/FliY